ncbi:MAG: ACP S-malonyltransferase [bacterium]|nr:ACP S-malonyltransferase [bacterium]
MQKIAYVFPGQGSQSVGMGYDFYQNFEPAKRIFDEADKVLGYPLTRLCFEGPIEKLSQTQYSQPAILTTSIACLEVLKENLLPTTYYLLPTYLAGHSLGEYSALVAAGGIEFKEAVHIVHQRALFMQEEAEKYPAGMTAILGLERAEVERICREESVEVANINCPGQIVISGLKECLEKAGQKAVAAGAKRAISLAVNGAFHSSYMLPAQEKLARVLSEAEIKNLQIPVIANITAKPITNPDEIRESLTKQISGSVLWEDSVRFMIKQGVTTFIEIGPEKVLKGLIRRIASNISVKNIENMVSLKEFNV